MLRRSFLAMVLMASTVSAFGAVSAGLVVGDPTGLSFKSWNGSRAYQFGMGWHDFAYRDRWGYYYSRAELHVTADYLQHNHSVMHLHDAKTPFYYGIGAAVWAGQVGAVGVRVPLGLDFIFNRAPLDVFVEIAPTMLLVPGTHLEIGAAAGVRYRFN